MQHMLLTLPSQNLKTLSLTKFKQRLLRDKRIDMIQRINLPPGLPQLHQAAIAECGQRQMTTGPHHAPDLGQRLR